MTLFIHPHFFLVFVDKQEEKKREKMTSTKEEKFSSDLTYRFELLLIFSFALSLSRFFEHDLKKQIKQKPRPQWITHS